MLFGTMSERESQSQSPVGRSCRVTVRVSGANHALLSDLAAAEGSTVSHLCAEAVQVFCRDLRRAESDDRATLALKHLLGLAQGRLDTMKPNRRDRLLAQLRAEFAR